MKLPKITPGPWKWHKRGGMAYLEVLDLNRSAKWRSEHPEIIKEHEEILIEVEANAKAITAVPILLATLNSVYKGLQDIAELTDGEHGGVRDVGTKNLVQEKMDWIKAALLEAGCAE